MPQRINPRTEVPAKFAGPDFLTSELPPSARPGHQVPVPELEGNRSYRRYLPSSALLIVLTAAAVPSLLTWWTTGAVVDGLLVAGFVALCAAAAAIMIG